MLGGIWGARLDQNLSVMKAAGKFSSTSNTALSAYAGAKYLLVSAGAEVRGDIRDTYNNAFSSGTELITTNGVGGSAEYIQNIHQKADYNNWNASITGNEAWCDYITDSLIPIYEFVQDAAKKVQIQAAFNNYLSGRVISVDHVIDGVYNITFDTDGGSIVYAQMCAEGASISAPTTTPTKTNYLFAGWYSDKGCTAKVSFPYTPPRDITLYAKWVLSSASKEITGSIYSFTSESHKDGTDTNFENLSLSSMGFDLATLEGLYTSVTIEVEYQYRTGHDCEMDFRAYANGNTDKFFDLTENAPDNVPWTTAKPLRGTINKNDHHIPLTSDTISLWGRAQVYYTLLWDDRNEWYLGDRTYTVTFNK
jgi:uncharacterized repeat protein (TIGR02543 family)